MSRRLAAMAPVAALLLATALTALGTPLTPTPTAAAAHCGSSVGPGIPPPASVPSGIPGFHAAWYGQSGYPTLCPGEMSTATVAYYNSGSQGWVANRMGEMAFLGTWDPIPGQDRASQLGGDGVASPATGWPRANRVAAQPAEYVGPNQVSWFQFTIVAPTTPGTFVLYVRPLIEGATWMEDYGVFWQVTVKPAEPEVVSVTPTIAGTVEVPGTRSYVATLNAPGCVDLALIDAAAYPAGANGELPGHQTGSAQLSSAALYSQVGAATTGASYVDCVAAPTGQTLPFIIHSTTPNAYVRPILFRDLDGDNALDIPGEPWGFGGATLFVPPMAAPGSRAVTVGVANVDENYFTDAAGTATYRYDVNDAFQLAGMRFGLQQFEQLLSRGDTLAVTYATDQAAASTFNLTTDLGRGAPSVDASLDSWDGGATQNDMAVRLTEPPTNVDGISYSVQRASTGAGAGCAETSGSYAEIANVAAASHTNSALHVDYNLAIGAYCYRVGAINPITGITDFGYSQRVTVPNPPLPVARPRSLDARVTTSAGSGGDLDTGDVVKIAFDKTMGSPTGRQLRVQDANGSTADVRCLQLEQECTLNPATETLGGVVYPAGRVITITVRTALGIVAAGTTPGIQLNAMVVSSDLVDVAGNLWDLPASTDVLLGAPD